MSEPMKAIAKLKALEAAATPGPCEIAMGDYGRNRVNDWTIRKHEFSQHPFEGDLCDEWGLYPPLGESGPVALIAGKANAEAILAARNAMPALIACAEALRMLHHTCCQSATCAACAGLAALEKAVGDE